MLSVAELSNVSDEFVCQLISGVVVVIRFLILPTAGTFRTKPVLEMHMRSSIYIIPFFSVNLF